MRCQKCGFISFDTLDFCRKCAKPLGSLAMMLRGSTHNYQAPVFLHPAQLEKDTEILPGPSANVTQKVVIQGPDFDAIKATDLAPAKPLTANRLLATPATATTAAGALASIGAASVRATSQQPASEPSSGEDISPTWPLEKEPVAFMANDEQPARSVPVQKTMEIPPALADISDLAPPGRAAKLTVGKDDFDLDLGFNLRDMEEDRDFEDEEAATDSPKRQAAPVNIDSDLDLELDLDELSGRDPGDDQK